MQINDFIVIGDIYILTGSDKIEETKSLPKAVQEITTIKDKLKTEIRRAVQPPGVIKRPTAGELLAKDEPEIKKQTDNALRETLDAIPELKNARDVLEKMKGDK